MKPPMRRWTRSRTPILSILSQRTSGFYRPMARHQEHEINLILSGEATYRLGDDPPTTLTAGEILVMPAGTFHAIEVTTHLRMAAIHVHPMAFGSVSAKKGPTSRLLARLKGWQQPLPWRKVVAPDIFPVLERLAEEAVVEQNRQNPARVSMLAAMAAQAAVLLTRLLMLDDAAAASDTSTRYILTVRSWIDRHFAEECGINTLAKRAHLAPTYFAARFRQVVGTPPMQYVSDRRLEQARVLLERTAHPIKVVASSVGYTDLSHFTRAFRRSTGLPPAAYRIRMQATTGRQA